MKGSDKILPLTIFLSLLFLTASLQGASLSIETDPTGSMVFVDGIYLGRAPLQLTGIAMGTYGIFVKDNEGRKKSSYVNVTGYNTSRTFRTLPNPYQVNPYAANLNRKQMNLHQAFWQGMAVPFWGELYLHSFYDDPNKGEPRTYLFLMWLGLDALAIATLTKWDKGGDGGWIFLAANRGAFALESFISVLVHNHNINKAKDWEKKEGEWERGVSSTGSGPRFFVSTDMFQKKVSINYRF